MARASGKGASRWLVAAGTAVLVVAAALLVNDAARAGASSGADGEPVSVPHSAPPGPPATVYSWSATSPATHEGDSYALALTNGGTAQRIWVRTVIMDHMAGVNPLVIDERFDLAPGEAVVLTAVNVYGLANHFNTRIVSELTGLTFEVSLTDAAGERVAWFNERAFMQRALDTDDRMPRDERMDGHSHTAAQEP
jgi:hypothetical protein